MKIEVTLKYTTDPTQQPREFRFWWSTEAPGPEAETVFDLGSMELYAETSPHVVGGVTVMDVRPAFPWDVRDVDQAEAEVKGYLAEIDGISFENL